jgi:hypothetical protein
MHVFQPLKPLKLKKLLLQQLQHQPPLQLRTLRTKLNSPSYRLASKARASGLYFFLL